MLFTFPPKRATLFLDPSYYNIRRQGKEILQVSANSPNWQVAQSRFQRIPLLKRVLPERVNRPVVAIIQPDSFARTSDGAEGTGTPEEKISVVFPLRLRTSGWKRLLHPTQWPGIRNLYDRFVLPRKIKAQTKTLINHPDRRVAASEQQAAHAQEIHEATEALSGREDAREQFRAMIEDPLDPSDAKKTLETLRPIYDIPHRLPEESREALIELAVSEGIPRSRATTLATQLCSENEQERHQALTSLGNSMDRLLAAIDAEWKRVQQAVLKPHESVAEPAQTDPRITAFVEDICKSFEQATGQTAVQQELKTLFGLFAGLALLDSGKALKKLVTYRIDEGRIHIEQIDSALTPAVASRHANDILQIIDKCLTRHNLVIEKTGTGDGAFRVTERRQGAADSGGAVAESVIEVDAQKTPRGQAIYLLAEAREKLAAFLKEMQNPP